MSTFDLIARRAIVESDIEQFGITPEFVLTSWMKSRYREIIDELKFDNLNKVVDYAFVTTAQIRLTDIVALNNSNILTSAIGGLTSLLVGRYIRISNDNEWYRIIGAPTLNSITLDTSYANTSKGPIAAVIAKRYYNISSSIRWIFDIKNPRRAFTLTELNPSKMDEMFPNRVWGPGVPQWWSPYDWDESTGERIVEIYPPSDTTYRLEASGYSGIAEPTLSSSPHRDINERIIMEGALEDAFVYRATKEVADIVRARAFLDISMSHGKRYMSLLEAQRKRGQIDAPAPKVRLMIQRRDSFMNGLYDPIVTASDEILSRSPAIGNN